MKNIKTGKQPGTSKLELTLENLDEKAKTKILDFVEMCKDLEELINRENTILLDKGAIAFDGMFIRKINMLNKFEKELQDALLFSKECAPDNIDLRNMLIQKIQDVRRELSINATFQLRDLKKRTKRMAVLKDALLDFSKYEETGDTVCH